MAAPAPPETHGLPHAFGKVPLDVAALITPPPADFNPPLTLTKIRGARVLEWRGAVLVEEAARRETIECHIVVRLSSDAVALQRAAAAQLRALVWHVHELGRLGCAAGLGVARTDRHRNHPVSVPVLTAEELDALKNPA